MRYVMSRILGTDGGSKHRRSPGVYCTSLGGWEGTKWRSQPRPVRLRPEPSLLCADGGCRAFGRGAVRQEYPAPDSSTKRA